MRLTKAQSQLWAKEDDPVRCPCSWHEELQASQSRMEHAMANFHDMQQQIHSELRTLSQSLQGSGSGAGLADISWTSHSLMGSRPVGAIDPISPSDSACAGPRRRCDTRDTRDARFAHVASDAEGGCRASDNSPAWMHHTICTTTESMSRTSSFMVALSSDWPRTLPIRALKPTRVGLHAAHTTSFMGRDHLPGSGTASYTQSFFLGKEAEAAADVIAAQKHHRPPWYILNPTQREHLAWDLFSLMVLSFDIIMMPIVLGWKLKVEGILAHLAIISACFWTMDMFLSFVTSYFLPSGQLVVDVRRVVLRYVRTVFVFDLCMVTGDWLSIALSNGEDGVVILRLMRLLKLGRGIRALGMLRTMHVLRHMERLAENLSDTALLAAQVCKMLCGVLLAAHLITCGWYAIGSQAPTDTGLRWIDIQLQVGSDTVDYKEMNHAFQYSLAFHWTVAQLTLGSAAMEAYNTAEVVYTVVCVVLGLLLGSSLISSLSAAMVDSSVRHRDTNEKLRVLRRFLREKVRRPELSECVIRQFEEQAQAKRRLTEDKVQALDLISHNFRMEIRYEVLKPALFSHALFRLWDRFDTSSLHKACMSSMDLSFSQTGADMFVAGMVAEAAYHLVDGELMYRQQPDTAPVQVRSVEAVLPGAWLSEATLWVHWIHVGKCIATKVSEVLSVRATSFWESVRGAGVVTDLLLEYAKGFHKRLTGATPPESRYPTDLEVPDTTFVDITLSFSEALQRTLLEDACQQLNSRSLNYMFLGADKVDNLRAEVNKGKSAMIVDEHGEVRRAVAVVVLDAVNKEGKRLVQIGAFNTRDCTVKAKCNLPGSRQERGELPIETMQRILSTKLWSLADGMSVIRSEKETSMEMSKAVGVYTIYLRTVLFAKVEMEACEDDALTASSCRPRPSTKSTKSSQRASTKSSQRMSTGTSATSSQSRRPWADRLPQFNRLDVRILHDLWDIPVHAIPEKNAQVINMFAWLTEEQFKELSLHDDLVAMWLASLTPALTKKVGQCAKQPHDAVSLSGASESEADIGSRSKRTQSEDTQLSAPGPPTLGVEKQQSWSRHASENESDIAFTHV